MNMYIVNGTLGVIVGIAMGASATLATLRIILWASCPSTTVTKTGRVKEEEVEVQEETNERIRTLASTMSWGSAAICLLAVLLLVLWAGVSCTPPVGQ